MRKVVHALVSLVLMVECIAMAQDQGITSETHKKNVGKIAWAKERIKFDAQDQISLQDSFDANDPIYGRVYLPKSLVRLGEDAGKPNPGSRYQVKVFVNDADKGVINDTSFESPTWTTVQINLSLASGDKVDRQNSGVPEKWFKLVQELPQGTPTVRVEFWGGAPEAQQKFAEGTFTLKKAGEVRLAANKLAEAKMTNPDLQKEMIEAVKAMGWTNETPVKVIIIEPEWRIIRNELGTITHRELNTHVVLKKTADGTYRANDISFRQEYQGGEKYGRTAVYGVGMKTHPVSPEDAEKK